MLEAVTLKGMLANRFDCWINYRLHWQRRDVVGLQILCEHKINAEIGGQILLRPPSALAWKAHSTGLRLPKEWRCLLTRRQLSSDPSPRRRLQYPFIVEVRGEHADLLAVNSLVPHGLPDHMRADVCQEILLALWQKEISLDELRADRAAVNKFIRGVRKANYEAGGYALSLDVPMKDGRSWYDVLPAAGEYQDQEAQP